jgi:hypothetical protein
MGFQNFRVILRRFYTIQCWKRCVSGFPNLLFRSVCIRENPDPKIGDDP